MKKENIYLPMQNRLKILVYAKIGFMLSVRQGDRSVGSKKTLGISQKSISGGIGLILVFSFTGSLV